MIITRTDEYNGKMGDRNPAVFILGDGSLSIQAPINGHYAYQYNTDEPISSDSFTAIEVMQQQTGPFQYNFTIKIKGNTVHSVINKTPMPMQAASLYVGFSNAANVLIRDLKGKVFR